MRKWYSEARIQEPKGGISNLEDVIKENEKNAFGVILGKALYENLITIEEARKIT